MEFLRSFLKRHAQFAGKPLMASRKVGCFLRLRNFVSLSDHTRLSQWPTARRTGIDFSMETRPVRSRLVWVVTKCLDRFIQAQYLFKLVQLLTAIPYNYQERNANSLLCARMDKERLP